MLLISHNLTSAPVSRMQSMTASNSHLRLVIVRQIVSLDGAMYRLHAQQRVFPLLHLNFKLHLRAVSILSAMSISCAMND